MTAKELADLIESIPIDDDVVEIGLTPQQRDLIVKALRALGQST